jgi:hypothetical protein
MRQFFYIFREDWATGIAVVDLSTMEETTLFYAADGFGVYAFALSPQGDGLIFAQVQEIPPEDGPYSDYISEVYRFDFISGHMQLLTGAGMSLEPTWSYVAEAYWLNEDLVGLGRHYGGNPGSESPLSIHRIDSMGDAVGFNQLDQHVTLVSPDKKHLFMGDWNSGDGWDQSFQWSVWHLANGDLRPRQLTVPRPNQIQQDHALAFSEERELLFISRFKGFEDSTNLRPIYQGLLVDLQGREFTLMAQDIRAIEQAVWIGDDLYVRLPSKIVKVTLD